jgi:hypothetical protein
MTHSTILSLRQALCILLGQTDNPASRALALLGICISDVYLGAVA